MNSLFRRYSFSRDLVVFVLLSLTALGLIFLGNDQSQNGAVQAVAVDLMGRLAAPVRDLESLRDLRNENGRLRQENALLLLEQTQLREAGYENSRLRQLLDLSQRLPYDTMPARVLGRNTVGIHTLLISVGRNSGIAPNMPVLSSLGLVGKVLDVGKTSSTVHLLTDRNFRVAVRVQRTRVEGIFQWSEGAGGSLHGVHHRASVAVGDTIVTSGMSSIFPSGLLVGIVEQIDSQESVLFQKIRVQPTMPFDRLEEVTVIRGGWGRLSVDGEEAKR
ncbi:MAG TPA: rod shape-determining protein MreC [bacterium]|jgi:rod shape-determining protein MreC|nr:rod shape-determining protein MreC [bacterium]HPG45798.1 rod shape-determining protein MreC [bacterium]HPM97975.1 rod shape-determining protein MreC [bacterium]